MPLLTKTGTFTAASAVGDVIDAIGMYLDGDFGRDRMSIRDGAL